MASQKETEIIQHYQQLYNEFQQLANKQGELEVDKREHEYVILNIKTIIKKNSSVLTALNNLNKDRRCWRLIGGVLVERTVGEVLPAVQKNAHMLEETIHKMDEQLDTKEKELQAYKDKYKIKVKAPNNSAQDKQEERAAQGYDDL